MSVSSIGGSSFNLQEMASKMAGRIMKEADSDGSGTLNRAELKSFQASMGAQGPDVDDVFATYNTSGNGELTQSELQRSIETEGARMRASGGMRGGGTPPEGLSQAGKSSSSEKVSSDPKDLNQDGKVTEVEILIYSLRHPDQSQVSETGMAGTQGSVDLTA